MHPLGNLRNCKCSLPTSTYPHRHHSQVLFLSPLINHLPPPSMRLMIPNLAIALLSGLTTAAPAVYSPTEGFELVQTYVPDSSISSADAETILTTPHLGLSRPYQGPIRFVKEDQTPANTPKGQNEDGHIWLYYCKHPEMRFCYHRWAPPDVCYMLTFFNNV
jgi:hypothetical protein